MKKSTKKTATKVKPQGDPVPIPSCPPGYKWNPITKECVANPG